MPTRKPRERVYPAQLVHMETADVAGRLRAWADVRKVDFAPLLREIVHAGLAALEPEWIEEYGGELDATFLARHVSDSVKPRRSQRI